MECQSLKTDQRLESPLDVLSRAASMIQKETSRINDIPKSKDVKERESSSDSGFEDSPSSPTKLHTEKPNSPSKILASRERRERRVQDRRVTNVTINANLSDKWKEYRNEEEIYRALEKSQVKKCSKNCAECSAHSYPASPKNVSYIEQTYAQRYPDLLKSELGDKEDDRHIRINDDRDLRAPKYSRIHPPPFVSLHPPPFSWFPHPFPSPLSFIRRQSVITSTCCPQQYVNSEGVSICPCANPKCNIQAISFGNHIGSQAVGKREVFSAVPPGFELPTVEEHFRKSLGSDYEEDVASLNSVDEHFAKALGNTWYNLKYKKAIESQFRTRERVLSGCNF